VAITDQDFAARRDAIAASLEDMLDRILPQPEGEEAPLHEAMRYSALGGGKRLRPFILVSVAQMFNVSDRSALLAAAALECIHCYSLVHDDLPAMDDDDLRRGQPTTHIKFDEATAILAGDALLTLAFEILADEQVHGDPAIRIELVRILSRAAGIHGMVGGQMMDLEAEKTGHHLSEAQITRLQMLKTGALIAVACDMGAVLGHAAPQVRQALTAYAHDVGLAFQIADDLLDYDGDEQVMGKRARKDAAAGKATFVAILGPDRARVQAGVLVDQAIAHLSIFGDEADPLRALAQYVLSRKL